MQANIVHSTCFFLLCLRSLLSNPEEGSSVFVGNVCKPIPDYIGSHQDMTLFSNIILLFSGNLRAESIYCNLTLWLITTIQIFYFSFVSQRPFYFKTSGVYFFQPSEPRFVLDRMPVGIRDCIDAVARTKRSFLIQE